jgi:hypothetical protein
MIELKLGLGVLLLSQARPRRTSNRSITDSNAVIMLVPESTRRLLRAIDLGCFCSLHSLWELNMSRCICRKLDFYRADT